MKPPTRKRAVPRRYDALTGAPAPNLRLVWTTREKKELLQGLRTQVNDRTPVVSVQGRSDEEVASYFAWLRGRAAREAMQMEYGRLVRQKKIHENQDPAAIELWTDLASRICSATEDAMTAAFSQVLTIASTEPVTLRHSIPCKEPPATPDQTSSPWEKSPQQKGSSEAEPSSAGEEPSSAGEEPSNADDGWNSLDFEKIYKYLSKTVRGETPPKLSDFESAVILHLLRCIPDQFQHLDAPHIGPYLYDTYTFLTTELESGHTEGEESQSGSQTPNWKELGFCPLNPFMIPLKMLRQIDERVKPL